MSHPHMLSPRNPGQPPEQLDALLRSFFRAEMPDPWPVLKAPAEEPFRAEHRPAPRWTAFRSRMALAASITLLVLGSWCFSAKAPDYSLPPQDTSGSTGTADKSFPKKAPAKTSNSGCPECCNPDK